MNLTILYIETDQKERVAAIVQTAISSEIKRLELALNRSNRCIEAYEKKYHVSSDDSLTNFTAEKYERRR